MITDFASTTQDNQWVHIDEIKATQYLPEGKLLRTDTSPCHWFLICYMN